MPSREIWCFCERNWLEIQACRRNALRRGDFLDGDGAQPVAGRLLGVRGLADAQPAGNFRLGQFEICAPRLAGMAPPTFKIVMTGLSPIAGGMVGYLFSAKDKRVQKDQ